MSELLESWDDSKNRGLTPRDAGGGCPVCAGKAVIPGENDLATLFPAISAQWHPTRNGALTPEMVTVGSHKKVWWQCKDGHVWQAVIHSRTGEKKCGCPVCAGKVKRKRYDPSDGAYL